MQINRDIHRDKQPEPASSKPASSEPGAGEVSPEPGAGEVSPGRSWGRWWRYLLAGAGTLFVLLGILGIFLPLLPTTPFLLLAAACYMRSSQRLYHWLMYNRWLGEYLRNYREGRGMPLRLKAGTLFLLWTAILYSAFVVVEHWALRLLLLLIAASVTAHLLIIKTTPPRPPGSPPDTNKPSSEN